MCSFGDMSPMSSVCPFLGLFPFLGRELTDGRTAPSSYILCPALGRHSRVGAQPGRLLAPPRPQPLLRQQPQPNSGFAATWPVGWLPRLLTGLEATCKQGSPLVLLLSSPPHRVFGAEATGAPQEAHRGVTRACLSSHPGCAV